MSNGFSSADMSTAAANGHAEGYHAGFEDAAKLAELCTPAAAQKAVAIHVNAVDSDGSILYVYPPIAKRGDKLYLAAPVAAAPVDLDAHGLRALDNCIRDLRRLLELAEDFALDDMQIQSLLTAIESMELRKRTSTPAAPGIDLGELAELLRIWLCNFDSGVRPDDDSEPEEAALWDRIERIRQQAIDASPKGGSDWEATDADVAAWVARNDLGGSFGSKTDARTAFEDARSAEQATSAEVGA